MQRISHYVCVGDVDTTLFLTSESALFFSLETRVIELKLEHDVQNGLSSGLINFFGNIQAHIISPSKRNLLKAPPGE